MKLSDNVYNFLKWIALIFLPALAILVSVVLPVWNIGGDLGVYITHVLASQSPIEQLYEHQG